MCFAPSCIVIHMVFRQGGLLASPLSIFGQTHPLLLRRRPVSRRPWMVLGLRSPAPPPEGSARCFVMFCHGYWAQGRGRCPSVRCMIRFYRFILLFSAFFALHGLSQVSSPRAFSFPGVFRSREAHPGHAQSREWSARSVAGPQKIFGTLRRAELCAQWSLEVRACRFFIRRG